MAIGRRDVFGARTIQPIGENCVVAAVRFEMCLACLSARPTLHGCESACKKDPRIAASRNVTESPSLLMMIRGELIRAASRLSRPESARGLWTACSPSRPQPDRRIAGGRGRLCASDLSRRPLHRRRSQHSGSPARFWTDRNDPHPSCTDIATGCARYDGLRRAQ
jgi:hypothetical protein